MEKVALDESPSFVFSLRLGLCSSLWFRSSFSRGLNIEKFFVPILIFCDSHSTGVVISARSIRIT